MNIYDDNKLEQIKQKVDLLNLRSDYFLIKLSGMMKKYNTLNIMKYNKKLQKRLNLSIKDYKKYSQLYSSIELELKIKDNNYNKFINISNEEKKYYHIYFDNSNEEIEY